MFYGIVQCEDMRAKGDRVNHTFIDLQVDLGSTATVAKRFK